MLILGISGWVQQQLEHIWLHLMCTAHLLNITNFWRVDFVISNEKCIMQNNHRHSHHRPTDSEQYLTTAHPSLLPNHPSIHPLTSSTNHSSLHDCHSPQPNPSYPWQPASVCAHHPCPCPPPPRHHPADWEQRGRQRPHWRGWLAVGILLMDIIR